MDKKDIAGKISNDEMESLELLQKAHEKNGKQLRVDSENGSMSEIDELKEMLVNKSEDPEEKYNIYYKGIRNILLEYLPKGKLFKEGRDLIYDEKNIFLNRGKKKSDNGGIRKSDGRMTYQPIMNEMLEIVSDWISTTQNPFDLYLSLYELNEKHGYGHENYDKTTIKFKKSLEEE